MIHRSACVCSDLGNFVCVVSCADRCTYSPLSWLRSALVQREYSACDGRTEALNVLGSDCAKCLIRNNLRAWAAMRKRSRDLPVCGDGDVVSFNFVKFFWLSTLLKAWISPFDVRFPRWGAWKHRRSQGAQGSHGPRKIFRISGHFVLWEAVSQTKYCC